jgi:hypothetical protein
MRTHSNILHRIVHGLGIALLAISLAACSSLLRNPVPLDAQDDATIPGYGDIRYYVLTEPEPLRQAIRQAYLTETPENYDTLPDGSHHYNYLAISGGGSAGAFGTGILNGWSVKGDRPKFKVVTGVSTGGLIAPFAFLGPDYDAQIKKAYTTTNPGRIYTLHDLISILWEESLADNQPLKDLVATYITQSVVDAVAAEHAKGRRLYIASTDMDREEPVIWDMGAIASSKDPVRLELFRTVLIASASIPAVFPPTMIKVNSGGKHYDEMHCDGGVFFEAFFIGSTVDLPALIQEAHPEFTGKFVQSIYVIRNGSTAPVRKQIKRGIGSISGRAISTLFKVSGINDLWRFYLVSLHEKAAFRYVSIPSDYVPKTDEEFNEAEMNRQYQLGYKLAIDGIPWMTAPPGYTLHDESGVPASN